MIKHALDRMGWAVAGALALALVAVVAGVVRAGPLDPPGPPGSTMKTLEQIEPRTPISSLPYTITESGSYYLTGDLTGGGGGPGVAGVSVHHTTAGPVTIDLNGFTLWGVPGSAEGITGGNGVHVLNGTVRDWGARGIYLGELAVIDRVTVEGNGVGGGITVGYGSTLRDCAAHFNQGYGIWAGAGASVTNCTAVNNAGVGFHMEGGTLRDCVAWLNLNDGIQGILGVHIEGCAAVANGGSGIAISGSAAVNNTVRDNGADGIMVTLSGSLVSGNTLITNGTGAPLKSGIYVPGSDNRIDGNHVTGQAHGIYVNGTGNAIVRNSARSNTTADYVIFAGNDAAPVTSAASATNPWANIQSP